MDTTGMNYETRVASDQQLLIDDRPRRSRRWLIIGAAIAVLGIVIALLAFHSGSKPAAPAATAGAGSNEQLPTVSVVAPGRSTIERTISATGTIAAKREMPVGVAGEGGRVTRVLVEPGQWVGAGQVLATVDASVQVQQAASLAASIAAAQADYKLAQSELARAQQLVARGFISKADIESKTATRDAALAKVRVAQAQLGQQRASNRRLDIRAPEAGLVLTRQVEPGQIVSAGSGVLFRMAAGGLMEMRAQLAETDLVGLPVGAPAQVTPVGSAISFPGRVWQVSPVIDPTTRQGIARIELRYNPALRPGGFAAATIRSGADQAPLLPNSAIQSDGKGNYVYILGAGDKVERRSVRIGEVSDNGVSIADGLDGTERVVVSAGAFLNPGMKIKPVLEKAAAAP